MTGSLTHFVNGASLVGPFDQRLQKVLLAMGCFWGAERLFWQLPGVVVTAAVYAGGDKADPGYGDVCSGLTGHAEAVLVVYDPEVVSLSQLFEVFWENHDPTQYMGQGNDVGPQYRSAIFGLASEPDVDETLAAAAESLQHYQSRLDEAGFAEITTEIKSVVDYYLAEPDHQQYLAKNPHGYCNHGFCQVSYS